MTRRELVRSAEPRHRLATAFGEDLTDRQRAALLTAFHAGFFTVPRESTGEDVADAMGISTSTFHRHVRLAEQKILRRLFTVDTERRDRRLE